MNLFLCDIKGDADILGRVDDRPTSVPQRVEVWTFVIGSCLAL